MHICDLPRLSALVVDHDPRSSHLVGSSLMEAGITPFYARNGFEMWRCLDKCPNIIVLDLCLPDMDGLDLLRRLRQESNIPVLIHSSRSETIDRILSLEIGADDFLPKSCNPRELIARTRGLIRRAQAKAGAAAEGRMIRFDQWTLDTAAQELSNGDGASQRLTRYAFNILVAFLNQPFEPLSRDFLSAVLKRTHVPYDRVIDVHVSNMRRILGVQSNGSQFIKSLRSLGYIFVASIESEKILPTRREAFLPHH